MEVSNVCAASARTVGSIILGQSAMPKLGTTPAPLTLRHATNIQGRTQTYQSRTLPTHLLQLNTSTLRAATVFSEDVH